MGEVLLVVLGVFLAWVLISVLAVYVAVRRLKRRNRVSPAVPCDAPVRWLCTPSRAAMLHRRLRRSVYAVRQVRGPAAELAADLEAHAVAVDRHLVLAARAPMAPRQRLLREVAAQVDDIESLTERVLSAAAAPLQPGPERLAVLAERLDTLEAAQAEIAALEEAAGLPPSSHHERRLP